MTSIPEQPRQWPPTERPSIEEIVRQQGVKAIESVEDVEALAQPGAFESEEELADFLADLYASRHRFDA